MVRNGKKLRLTDEAFLEYRVSGALKHAPTTDGILLTVSRESKEYRALMIRERETTIPMGRVAVGDDIARMAAFLSSSESDYVTGLSISVAGGTEMN